MFFGVFRLSVSGDKNKIIEKYLALRPALVRFLIARFKNESIAEDIVQEIYFKLNRMPEGTEIGNIEAYLFKTANNLALDFRKSTIRRGARERAWNDISTHSVKGEPVHDRPNAVETIESRQRLAYLKDLINELSPQCRKVFIAHKIQGYSHKEIAKDFHISRSAVEKHIAKALKQLAANMKKEE